MRHDPLLTRRLGFREEQVLRVVHETVARDGMAPSYTMICAELGISTRGHVSRIVQNLERRGLLSRVGTGRCPRSTNAREVRRIALAS